MARASLTELLGKVETDPPGAQPAAEISMQPAPPKTPRKPRPTAPDRHVRKPVEEPVDELSGPLYLRLVRKDTRLREDQIEALTAHARRLNRKRPTGGVRLTENSLIRVAVDLLLDRIEEAPAGSEEQIREALRDEVSTGC